MDSSEGKPSSEATNDQDKVLAPTEIGIYQRLYENGDMSRLVSKVEEDINKWRNVPVNIAVTGNCGVGKSSFIKSFRDIRANCEGAAEVGVDETTTIPKKYVHPVNDKLALWDLTEIPKKYIFARR
jgi:predicted GTPase